jgi:hypothetical protein
MALWTRLSTAQRSVAVAYVAGFATLLLGSLLLDRNSAVASAWWSVMIVLAAAVPAAAIAFAWWVMFDPRVAQPARPGDANRRQPSQPLGIALALGLSLIGRVLDRHAPPAVAIGVMIWWLAAIVILFVALPRMQKKRA